MGLVPRLVWWRLKLVAELRPGVMMETEVARIATSKLTWLTWGFGSPKRNG
jgi:hypothetical protein